MGVPVTNIQLFSTLKLTRNGQPLAGLRSRKAVALLAYLLVTDQPASRARLVELLWSAQPEKRARANLSWALNHLKQHFGPHVQGNRSSVWFVASDAVSVDLHEFQSLLAASDEASLRRGVGLVQGELLADFAVSGSPAFEQWLLAERERVVLQAARALEQLVSMYLQQSDYQAALPFAEQWVRLMPWREAAHRLLMRCLIGLGQREAASAQFEQCRRILARELGVEPAAETLALYEQLQLNRATAPATILHNLTQPQRPLVGRSAEMARVEALMRSDRRLLTLVGVGGIGKTRLAQEIAHDALASGQFPDGVYFVPAANIAHRAELALAIARTVACPLDERSVVETALHNFLRAKRMLLVLDNFEQLLDAAPLVSDLLAHAAALNVLVTSQARLRLLAETVFPVEGLSLKNQDAAKLFLACAEQQGVRFVPSTADHAAIDAICHLVQGSPLAIQLAATWLPLLRPPAILKQIRRDLDLVSAEISDLPDRHQSLRAVFEYGWDLLGGAEQKLLQQLAIFPSDFSYEMALDVTQGRPSALLRLVNRSLVQVVDSGRYQLHALTKQFAAGRIKPKLLATTQYRLGQVVAQQLAAAEKRFESTERETVAALQQDWETLNLGWHILADTAQWDGVDAALRALDHFLTTSSRSQLGIDLLQYVLARADDSSIDEAPPELRGKLLTRIGIFRARLGQYNEGRMSIEAAIPLLQPNSLALALAHMGMGSVDRDLGTYAEALDSNQLALDIIEAHDAPWLKAVCMNQMGMILMRMGDLAGSADFYQHSLDLYRQIGSRWAMTQPLNNLAIVAYFQKRYDEAQRLMDENATIYAEIGDIKGQAVTLGNQATMAYETGDAARAIPLFERCVPLCQQMGDRWLLSNTLCGFGYALAQLARLDEAQNYFIEALSEAHAIDVVPLKLFALVGVAQVKRLQGKVVESAEILTVTLDHDAHNPTTKRRSDTELTALLEAGTDPESLTPATDNLSQIVENLLRSSNS